MRRRDGWAVCSRATFHRWMNTKQAGRRVLYSSPYDYRTMRRCRMNMRNID